MLEKIYGIIVGRISLWYLVIYKALFEIVYVYRISPIYDYMGYHCNPNFDKAIVSWLSFAVFILLIDQIRSGILKDLLYLFFYLNGVATFSIYWMKDESTSAFCLILLWWSVFAIIVYIMSKQNLVSKNMRTLNIGWNNPILLGIYMLMVLFYIYAAAKHSGFRLFVSFYEIDLYRFSEGMGRIGGYIFAINANVFLPLFLTLHIRQKKWLLVLCDVLLSLLAYGMFANKSIFFTMIMAIIIGVVGNYQIAGVFNRVIGFFLIIYQLICIVIPFDLCPWFVALDERLLAGTSVGHYYYYDFFSNSEKLCLAETHFALKPSPYSDKVAVLIGSSSKYMSGNWNWFNNGLFSMAYANFGFWGIFIQPLFILFTYYIMLRLMQGVDDAIKYSLIMVSIIYLISTSYTSWLVTGGAIPIIALFLVLRKKTVL
jgi:hypothetical protein